MHISSAFVPHSCLFAEYKNIKNEVKRIMGFNDKFNEFLEYFENTYVNDIVAILYNIFNI